MDETKEPGNHCSEEKGSVGTASSHRAHVCVSWKMRVISMRSTLAIPARARGPPRDHMTPGPRGSWIENSWDHSQGPLMNMQTQIDLFPVGMGYYSQILISLQIPPVSLAFPTILFRPRPWLPGDWRPNMDMGRRRGI